MAALNSGLRNNSSFTSSLLKKPVVDMADLLRRVEKYVSAEGEMATRKQKTPRSGHQEERGEHSRNAPGNKEKRKERSDLPKDDLRHKLSRRDDSPRGGAPIPPYNNFAPLLDTRTRILILEQDKVPIQCPEKMRSPTEKRDTEKYCRYHRDHVHDTEECRQLKNQINVPGGRYTQPVQCHNWATRSEPNGGDSVHETLIDGVPYKVWRGGSQRRPTGSKTVLQNCHHG
ncbi:hypothetical protein CFOL_v3_05339 [Cephalotus follicularis]|uniref:Uncharacterized protein n=1 Tax=Cephalotus follicularis TaxID=3775 RepID=A0A1Q3B1W9_CEPFO|nr:hypothetical protein CFOL_v3_05339 [Cephalotus follicularis]